MKDAQHIFSQLLQRPDFTLLKVRLQLDKLKLYLPDGIRVGLRSIVMKNSKLLLVFKHPSAYNYFNGQKGHFAPTLLNAAQKLDIPIKPTEVQGYLPRRIQQSFETTPPKLYYHERARGDFENPFKDPELRAILENIRTCIKKHHASTEPK
ncbi:hypothetical protein NHP190012_13360 [Helicobacter sp. NHP19-012]|uniref:DUF721 domain-containing protein n=1 Tax=Helicobacter gastrofelis TaxID=2849642 RepID=A0ABN6IAI2_9HELI|nr:hypothetical protein [Helicobacter sp. NHP19-012]BCZ19694.1 hypothetical protein NHP190012_13360 [Helicobacter sp. NHP19-012]